MAMPPESRGSPRHPIVRLGTRRPYHVENNLATMAHKILLTIHDLHRLRMSPGSSERGEQRWGR